MMLRTVPDEPDQVPRLDRFRAAHPDVRIAAGETGWWQGRIPEPDGEMVITRYTLCDLLKLDQCCRQPGTRSREHQVRHVLAGSPSRHAAPQERSGRDSPDARDPGLGFGSGSSPWRRQPAS